MNTVIQRKIEINGAYSPLSAGRLVGTFEVSTPPGNTGDVIFEGDDGSEVPWIPGEYHTLVRVDLSRIRVKGTPGDIVTVIGGTW